MFVISANLASAYISASIVTAMCAFYRIEKQLFVLFIYILINTMILVTILQNLCTSLLTRSL